MGEVSHRVGGGVRDCETTTDPPLAKTRLPDLFLAQTLTQRRFVSLDFKSISAVRTGVRSLITSAPSVRLE